MLNNVLENKFNIGFIQTKWRRSTVSLNKFHAFQESLARFDSSLFELFQRRLKVDAAMNHEQLKILRIYQLNDDRIRREIQEREIV